MAKQLLTSSIAAPGFYGLNTMDSEVTLNQGFARNAENCIIDEGGRLGSRNGWAYIAQTATPETPINLKGMHRFVDINGEEYFGCWSDDAFYVRDGGNLNAVTYTGSQTISDGKWQAATLNDAAYLVQSGYEPIYFDPVAGELDDISNHPSYSATAAGAPEGNTILSAYGRIWIADEVDNKTTVYWSDLLSGVKWNSGTSGSLDISSNLVYGNDEIVGLGAHNGYLIIFCKNNIIIMGDTDNQDQYVDPANMQLIEVIHGVGCIARDSIANTGTDIMFLSEAGVRSLGRTIQEKSQPMSDVSINVRDTLVDQVSRADKTQIKGIYSDHFAFYLLTIPDETTVWCFDMRGTLENGGARVTRWNGLDHTSWLAFDGAMYMTNTKGLAEYKGYQDNGSKYSMQYYTNYFDFEMPNMTKIVKRLSATVIGSTGQKFVAKVGTDYEDIYTSYNLTVKDAEVFEYNIAEYNIGEYSGAALIDNIRIPAGGSGFVVQLGFESEINGGFLNIQQIDLYVKQGRLN